jgi:uncharacterized protein (DUF433 family)
MTATVERPWAGSIKPVAQEDLVGDLIQPGHALFGLIWINRERVSGAPCFYASRVPIQHLFDYLEAGHTLDEFLADFDGITREQAAGVIALARRDLLGELPKA